MEGDGNFKYINWPQLLCSQSENSKDFKFLEAVKDAYLTQHVEQPTRGRGTDTPSTLDIVLTKNDDVLEDLTIEAPLGKSDHSTLWFKVACNFKPKPITKVRYEYDKADWTKLRNMLPKGEEWKD